MSRERRWITAFDEATRVAAKYGHTEAALVLMDAADEEQRLLAASIRRLREGDPRVWRSASPTPGPVGTVRYPKTPGRSTHELACTCREEPQEDCIVHEPRYSEEPG